MCNSHSIVVKCKKCNQSMTINRENCEQFIHCDDHNNTYWSYHSECFYETLSKRINATKGKNYKEIKKHWEQYTSEAIMEDVKNKSKLFFIDRICRDELYHFLIKEYELKVFPQEMFARFDQLYSGEYKNLCEPITSEDLLIMWKTKLETLNKLAMKRIAEGKTFKSEYSRLCWDISCLVQWYPKYKNWKIKQDLLVQEQQYEIEQSKKDSELNKAIYLQSKKLSERDRNEIDEEWKYNHRFDGMTLEEMINKYW